MGSNARRNTTSREHLVENMIVEREAVKSIVGGSPSTEEAAWVQNKSLPATHGLREPGRPFTLFLTQFHHLPK